MRWKETKVLQHYGEQAELKRRYSPEDAIKDAYEN